MRKVPSTLIFAPIIVIAAMFAPLLACGQSTFGTILGRITDQSGASISRVQVVLRNEQTNISTTKITTGNGEYVFSNINPGTYQIHTTAAGFSEYNLDHINVSVSQTVRENISLTVGKVTATIQVRAEHPLVQTDTSSIGSVIESKQVNQMPLDGRTAIYGLLALAPGVQSSGNEARISGNSWIGTNETLDGVDHMSVENARLSSTDPSLESIQEFRVIDSTGSAKYSGGTAQVILSSKSGTNNFHGSVFGFDRNRVLAARNFFQAPNSVKPPYDRSEFGASLGGPIKRNKLFFFGSYEALLFHSSSTNLSAQPTTALLNGNFTGLAPVIDPYTGQAFPNNIIPTSRFNAVSQKLFTYFSSPNRATSAPAGLGTNYVVAAPGRQRNYRYQGRVDYALSSKNSIFVRYYYVDSPSRSPGVTEKMGAEISTSGQQGLAVNYTRTFSANLVNLVTYGQQRLVGENVSQNASIDTSSLIPGLAEHFPGLGGLPSVGITGFTGITDYSGSGDIESTRQFSDALTWVRGSHTLEAGFTFMRWQFYNYQNGTPSHGSFSFTGQYTHNAFADFLLGYLAGSSQTLSPVTIEPLNYRYGMYVQDDWRATPRLTLNYGLRYDLPTLYTNSIGGMANWYPNLNSIVVLKGSYDPGAYPALPIIPGNQVSLNAGNYLQNDHTQIAPRFGFIYRPLNSTKLIVRGGYGLYYESMPWKFGSYEIGTNPPFSGVESFEPAAVNTPSLLFDNAFPKGGGSLPSEVGVIALSKNQVYPYTHQWNLTVESQLSPTTSVRATYLGSKRIHSGALALPNTPTLAPGPIQPRRPYQPFGNITLFENYQTSDTEQLQLSALRSYSSGLSYGVEYSWTKTLNASQYDQTAPTDPENPDYDRGYDPLIRRQYLVSNYVYDLPFGSGKHYLSSLPSVVNAIVGNWETSGVVTVGSGLPFSVNFSSSVEGWTSNRADKIGNPHVSDPSIQRWFNPAAYALPAQFTYGNSGANSLFGPKFVDWDLGVFKNFVLREGWRLQFRGEFFNALNHPNFSNPQSNISVPSQVGTITSAGSPRDIQFGIRLDF